MKRMFICQEGDSHNKFWSAERSGTSVHIEWGRIGMSNSKTQDKDFDSVSSAEDFITKKSGEKLKKGYVESNEEKLTEEKETAQALGWQSKINKLEWVWTNSDPEYGRNITINIQKDYTENCYALVEIVNSWSKEVSQVLVGTGKNKNKSFGVRIANRIVDSIEANITSAQSNFIEGVRTVIRRLNLKVVEVIKHQFGGVGTRFLDLGDDDETDNAPVVVAKKAEKTKFVAAVNDSSASNQVIGMFAAMGNRVLDI